jgi:hypothetical protein
MLMNYTNSLQTHLHMQEYVQGEKLDRNSMNVSFVESHQCHDQRTKSLSHTSLACGCNAHQSIPVLLALRSESFHLSQYAF